MRGPNNGKGGSALLQSDVIRKLNLQRRARIETICLTDQRKLYIELLPDNNKFDGKLQSTTNQWLEGAHCPDRFNEDLRYTCEG